MSGDVARRPTADTAQLRTPVGASRSGRRQPLINRLVARILRSPLAGCLDHAVLLLTVRGRRSGREVTLPVQYATGEDAIWVWPAHPDTKTWWRNLRAGAPVRVRLRGEDLDGYAHVVDGRTDPATVAAGLRAYAARFPRAVGVTGDQAHDDEVIVAAAARSVLVRLAVPAQPHERARRATTVTGHGLAATVRRHPLAAFFVLAYLFSWGYWVPLAVAGGHASHFPGLLGPMLAGLTVTAVARGRPGLRELGARMLRWRVPVRWYAAALMPAAVAALAFCGLRLTGRDWPSWHGLSDLPGLPAVGWLGVFALTLLVNGYGEETGWRGVAWPRLRERHTIRGAGLILAVPWAVWHVPLFWLDSGLRGFPPLMLPGFLIGMAAGAVVLGWLYERAGSSLLVVAVFHTTLNMVSATRATEGFVAAAVSTVVIGWAVAILRAEARSTRSRRHGNPGRVVGPAPVGTSVPSAHASRP